MTSIKKLRYVLFIIGLVILTFGSRIMLLSGMGVGGLDAFAIGLSRFIPLSLGMIINILGVSLIIIGAILKKKGLEWAPIITSILFGVFYDLWGMILFNKFNTPTIRSEQGLLFLAGILIGPLGVAIYILMDISTSSVDYLMLAVKERFNLSIQSSRILLEVIFVCGGWLTGGPIGVGTICIMLLFGPIIQVYYGVIKKVFNINSGL